MQKTVQNDCNASKKASLASGRNEKAKRDRRVADVARLQEPFRNSRILGNPATSRSVMALSGWDLTVRVAELGERSSVVETLTQRTRLAKQCYPKPCYLKWW